MDRLGRAGVALLAVCGGVGACQSIIGADFGNYRVGDDDTATGGTSDGGGGSGGGGGGTSGGRGGDSSGGSAGSATGGTGATPEGGSAGAGGGGGGGGTAQGGSGAGGESAGAGGGAGEDMGPLRAISVTGGREHTCALLEGGALKCWGYNFYGQLGQDHVNDRGDMFGELGDVLRPVAVGSGRSVKAVTTGYNHTCALLDDGHVRCWGRNERGQLGLGDVLSRGDAAGEMAALSDVNLGAGRTATSIDAGIYHTCAVLDDGSVRCWGDNTMGCLGLGTTETALGDESDETVDRLMAVDLGGARAVRISAGTYSTCALLQDETVKCWGENTHGELGIGVGPSRGSSGADMGAALPALALGEGAADVNVGSYFACALLRSGAVKCWGHNTSGQLGLGVTTESVATPTASVELSTGRTADALSIGLVHVCVILDTRETKCWGGSSSGALGSGNQVSIVGQDASDMGDALPAVDLGTEDTVFAIGLGSSFSCAVLESTRRIKCWGNNNSGQLGVGDTRNRGTARSDMGDALPFVDLGIGP